MCTNRKNQRQRNFKNIRINLLMLLLIVFSCEITFATENITIETTTDNFFENLISDTLLLLDPDLKKIIADDFDRVVTNSKFQIQVNSWKPRPNPKIRLSNIYKDIDNNNIKESFASLVQPVVELACTPQQYDPLNELASKCIKEMFHYPIIQPIEIRYTFESNKTKDQIIDELAGLSNSNRYPQMVRSTADILNSAFEKVRNKKIVKTVGILKYPLRLVAVVPVKETQAIHKKMVSYSSEAQKEKDRLENKLRYYEDNSSIRLNMGLRQKEMKIEEIKASLRELETDQVSYLNKRAAEEQRSARRAAENAENEARHQELQAQQAKRDADISASGPIIRLPNGQAINTGSGEFLAPSGSGYVGTRDGTFYTPAGPNGLTNTRSGQFTPVVR